MRGVRQLVTSVRGVRLVVVNALVAFAIVSGVVQFGGQVFAPRIPQPVIFTLTVLGGCLFWGFLRSYPRDEISREFLHPATRVTITKGDLFAFPGHLVVGFSDTFDTDTSDDAVISGGSVQGQLLARLYRGNLAELDAALTAGLALLRPLAVEEPQRKPLGKRVRYPIGSVVPLQRDGRRIFAVSYSRMGNDLVAESSVDELWLALSSLWDSVYTYAQRRPVAMPLVGSRLARLDALDRTNLLKLILMSYTARSRQRICTHQLVLILTPEDFAALDPFEIDSFLKSL